MIIDDKYRVYDEVIEIEPCENNEEFAKHVAEIIQPLILKDTGYIVCRYKGSIYTVMKIGDELAIYDEDSVKMDYKFYPYKTDFVSKNEGC